MNAPPRDPAGPELVTQENILLDAAERIGRIRDGRVAVHLHLSRLKPQNRQEGYLRVAGRMLEPMISAYRGQIFLLSNTDIVFLVNQPNFADLRDHIQRLRGLFAKDPLSHDDVGDGVDLFCTMYDLSYDYDPFLEMVQEAVADARARGGQVAGSAEPQPLDAAGLALVLERLDRVDIAPFIRRQSAIGFTAPGSASVIFQEFFVSLTDLQRQIAPDLQLQSNRWMFRHLTTVLDQKTLLMLQKLRLRHPPPAIHLNLALTSLDDPALDGVEAAKAPESRLSIEIQVLDLLADSRAFFQAQGRLRERGIGLVIDGLDEVTLRFLEVGRAGADLYKLEWSPDFPFAAPSLTDAISRIDPAKLVLARCDSETAIGWGVELGLQNFQGRYVEQMIAATTMAVCDKAAACSLGQCTQRHGVIGGSVRQECGNLLFLDQPPALRAPQRKGAGP